ncbi:DUF6745 domain-containing protein [Actinocorallia populi]|uniref:DUF6745 domain-containing protein n=1 Tax=Actinocorallia populi TaxID=2079200 RepID=UPI0018E53F75|nr:hypothetical protein [Actinocorallia populi]
MPFTALPADRARAEAGVRAAYAAAGLAPPASFLWVASPAAGALLSVLLRPGLPPGTRTALFDAPSLRSLLAGLRDHGVAPARTPASADGPASDDVPARGDAPGADGVSDTSGARGLEASGARAPVLADVPSGGSGPETAGPEGGQAARRVFEELFAGVETGACVRERVRTAPWERERAAARAELGPHGWVEAWARTGAFTWERVNELVTRIRRAIGELDEEHGPLLRAATLDAVLGQHDAPWLELFASLDRLAPLHGPAEVAASAGWWWPYENLVILSERPVELHRDEPGRLHNGDGPALSYSDGFALHAWRGMPIPPGFLDTLSGLTAHRILAEENAELRRVMLERFGYDRYLAEAGAQPLHRDETGVLWRIDLPDDEPVVMVEVVNSTPEPDGTRRTYYLRVPPDTRTARAGVAWTFGLTEAEYRPLQET